MTDALPNGLVKTISNVPEELGGFDKVRVEDIAQLWRVYTVNKSVLEENTGRRLENLFWRIWGSEQLFRNIGGSTVAKIFCYISESSPRIRTTPTQSPLVTRNFPQIEAAPGSHLRTPSPNTSPSPTSPRQDATSRPALTPILKSSSKASPTKKGTVSFDGSSNSNKDAGKRTRFSPEVVAADEADSTSDESSEEPPSLRTAAELSLSSDAATLVEPGSETANRDLPTQARPAQLLPAPVIGFSASSVHSFVPQSSFPAVAEGFTLGGSATKALAGRRTSSSAALAPASPFSRTPSSRPLPDRNPPSTTKGKSPADLLKTPASGASVFPEEETESTHPFAVSSQPLTTHSTSIPHSSDNNPNPKPSTASASSLTTTTTSLRQNVSSLTLSIDASRQRGDFISQEELDRDRAVRKKEREVKEGAKAVPAPAAAPVKSTGKSAGEAGPSRRREKRGGGQKSGAKGKKQ